MEQGYVGEPPIVKPEKEHSFNHLHRCPKCGEWMCDKAFCRKYAGMRVWCDKHDWCD